jgi:hypothetical protein
VFGYNLMESLDKELVVVLRARLLPELKSRKLVQLKHLDQAFGQGRDSTRVDFNQNWNPTEVREVGK